MSSSYTHPTTPSYTITPPTTTLTSPPSTPTPPNPPHHATPTAIPPLVYRVHRAGAQTRYAFSTGFSAKNHTTILNYLSALSRFGLAHLTRQTNISSPFISVYDDQGHAEAVARYFADVYEEDTIVVTVDTRYFARGPVFRAVDLLGGLGKGKAGEKEGGGGGKGKGRGKGEVLSGEEEWLHWGEYLVMYRIPPQAIRDETVVGRGKAQKWKGVGVIGSGCAR